MKLIKGWIAHYYHTIFSDLDAVQVISNGKHFSKKYKVWTIGSFRLNVRYLLPFLANVYFFAHAFVVFANVSFRYENLGESDALFTRKIIPTNLWHESDVMLHISMLWSTGVLACLMCHNLEEWHKCKMFVTANSADGTMPRVVQNGKGTLF